MEYKILWNKVEDMLPPIGKTVLTCDSKAVKVGIGSIKKYNNGRSEVGGKNEPQYPIWTSSNSIFNPTHWALIPNPSDLNPF